MANVYEAFQNWIRVVKSGGFLIITVPDEDLYERGNWPSSFNPDHKWTFTIYKTNSWSPKSLNVLDLLIHYASEIEVERVVLVNEFFDYAVRDKHLDQTRSPVTECCIEVIVRKK